MTTAVERRLRDFRGRRQKAALVALTDLWKRGCSAAGYRLAGAVLDHVCSRHLYGDDRMLTAWPAEDHAIVIAIGRHDRSSEDVYDVLVGALSLEVPETEREKPPCCDEEGRPPVNLDVATSIADAMEQRGRLRRRAR